MKGLNKREVITYKFRFAGTVNTQKHFPLIKSYISDCPCVIEKLWLACCNIDNIKKFFRIIFKTSIKEGDDNFSEKHFFYSLRDINGAFT